MEARTGMCINKGGGVWMARICGLLLVCELCGVFVANKLIEQERQ